MPRIAHIAGTTVAGGKYRVRALVGQGRFGKVFRAEQVAFGVHLRDVALKLFSSDYVTEERAPKVFREAILMEGLAADVRARGELPPLVEVYDIGILEEVEHTPYIAMEFVSGGTFRRIIRHVGRLPVPTVINRTREVCAGLKIAHAASPPIIHRDVKPENVLVTRGGFAKLADFGVAVDALEAIFGGGGGTVAYAPPDTSSAAVTPAYDVYSCGIMMLEMLLGANPLVIARLSGDSTGRNRAGRALRRAQERLAAFENPLSKRSLMRDLPELRSRRAFADVLRTCLQVDASDRFRDARGLDDALVESATRSDMRTLEPVAPSPTDHMRRAREHLRVGDESSAERSFLDALSQSPEAPDALEELACLLEGQRRFEQAIRYLKKLVSVRPDARTFEHLAKLYGEADRPDEAAGMMLLAGLERSGYGGR